ETNNLARCQDPPVVGLRVVAERGQPEPRLTMAPRGRVEVETGPGEVALLDEPSNWSHCVARVGAQHLSQVADPHVVGDDSKVVAPEAAVGELEVAHRRAKRLSRVEARVDAPPQREQTLEFGFFAGPPSVGDQPGQPSGPYQVDSHPEEVGGGLGNDLRESGRVCGIT